VKIDFKVDTASKNYDAFKGKMLAETADGNKAGCNNSKTEHPSFESGRMDKVSFASSISVQNPRYALGMIFDFLLAPLTFTFNIAFIGMMLDKELHLVPVKSMMMSFYFPHDIQLCILSNSILSNETKLFVLRQRR
jgi:hypothetical protein